MKKITCRFCHFPLSEVFVDLGVSPLANSFLTGEMLDQNEPMYPLVVYVCTNCLLVQVQEFEKPEKIFSDYAYLSSFSDSWLKHSKEYVTSIMKRFDLNENSFVIEIASNDGYLLQYFKEKNIQILGIEPAQNIAKIAHDKGIPTLTRFFNSILAIELKEQNNAPDLIIGNNVLAHVPHLNDFVVGLKILLKSSGIITIEFPHLLQLITQNQFDTIYHEHFSYFSLLVLNKIFSKHGLTIFDVEEIPTHGGSLRIYVKHADNKNFGITTNVNNIIEKEKLYGLNNISTYTAFSKKVISTKKLILEFFLSAKKEKKKVICYGAAAKGNTLLNYCEIGKDLVECVVDRNTHKQSLYLPGTHIPIKQPDLVFQTKPDYLVILPWNIKEEIMQQMKDIKKWGGKFVTLIPRVEIR
jgi:2-polyprenyl-3-methyl-5-hydroxy-6-metoxy-1,4-benzoquinol methylase